LRVVAAFTLAPRVIDQVVTRGRIVHAATAAAPGSALTSSLVRPLSTDLG
jgi:hypothetical protein